MRDSKPWRHRRAKVATTRAMIRESEITRLGRWKAQNKDKAKAIAHAARYGRSLPEDGHAGPESAT